MNAPRRWMALFVAVTLATGLLLAPATASATTIPLKKSGYPSPMREPLDQAGEPDTPWGRDLFLAVQCDAQSLLQCVSSFLLLHGISPPLLSVPRGPSNGRDHHLSE